MSVIDKYREKMMNDYVSNKDKEAAIIERLRLDKYKECIDYLDKNRKVHAKTAKSLTNAPEMLALGMTAYCIRNTCLEDFHAARTPIDDEKMKIFMKECSEKCAEVLCNLLSSDYMTRATMAYFLVNASELYCREWDIPDIINPSYLEYETK